MASGRDRKVSQSYSVGPRTQDLKLRLRVDLPGHQSDSCLAAQLCGAAPQS